MKKKENKKINQRCWNCKHAIIKHKDEGTSYYICSLVGDDWGTYCLTTSDGLHCPNWTKEK